MHNRVQFLCYGPWKANVGLKRIHVAKETSNCHNEKKLCIQELHLTELALK